MQPRGPLMTEHRLIERMIALIADEVKKIEKDRVVDHAFIDAAVDFMKFYADRTHHGKEEEILFRELSKKDLSAADRLLMDELTKEHGMARSQARRLVDAADDYRGGDPLALPLIIMTLKNIAGFYPTHIKKEDAVFFPASMGYLSETEQRSMLAEFRAFDERMIHEKYKTVVEAFEGKAAYDEGEAPGPAAAVAPEGLRRLLRA
jgi:hemerythrin-like domain-containing protein